MKKWIRSGNKGKGEMAEALERSNLILLTHQQSTYCPRRKTVINLLFSGIYDFKEEKNKPSVFLTVWFKDNSKCLPNPFSSPQISSHHFSQADLAWCREGVERQTATYKAPHPTKCRRMGLFSFFFPNKCQLSGLDGWLAYHSGNTKETERGLLPKPFPFFICY